MKTTKLVIIVTAILVYSCAGDKSSENKKTAFAGAKNEFRLMTLDPGHFHASLVQKEKIGQVDSVVYVFAPKGNDVLDHLVRVTSYNNRKDNPTNWVEKPYTGDDYLEKMLKDKPGNIVVIAGNNAKKTDYILKSIEAGINVLADKPMVISPEEFPKLEQAFKIAGGKGVLLYDIMTERFEITNNLQSELMKIKNVFGDLQTGTPENPAIAMESVHNFYKNVSGSALKRPAWFFDVNQQGEAIVDVGTHLVDLAQWEAFPEKILSKEDVKIISAKHWTTDLSLAMFSKVTGLDSFPGYLKKNIRDNLLKVYFNGEFNYTIKGINARVSSLWNFETPGGAGDTQFSIFRGTKCSLAIRQGKEQGYKPTLYVEKNSTEDIKTFTANLEIAVGFDLAAKYPGIKLVKVDENLWTIEIPEKYKVGHEAHFTQVTQNFLSYLKAGKMPDWEVPDMIVKYYTTTEALKKAIEKQ
jgi:predicted dehydrogenase